MRKIVNMAAGLSLAHAASACAGSPPRSSPRGSLPNSATTPESIAPDSTPSVAGKAAIGGCWDLVVREHPLRGQFSFVVEGNSLRGAVTLHGEEHQIGEGKASGDGFEFKIAMSGIPVQFEGELNESELRGTLTRSSERLSWIARRCPAK